MEACFAADQCGNYAPWGIHSTLANKIAPPPLSTSVFDHQEAVFCCTFLLRKYSGSFCSLLRTALA